MADPTKGDAGFNAAGVRRFDAGRPISAGQLNRMAAHSTAAQSRASGGGIYSSGPYGTILHPGTRSRRTSEPHPFKVLDASDGTGPKVRVLPGSFNGWESTVGGADNSSPNVWYPVGGRTEASPPIPTLSVSPSTPWIALYFESNIASGNVYSPWFTLHDVRALAASSEFLSGYESGTKRAHPIAYLQFDAAGKIMSIRQHVFRNLAGDCSQWQNDSHAYVRFWS